MGCGQSADADFLQFTESVPEPDQPNVETVGLEIIPTIQTIEQVGQPVSLKSSEVKVNFANDATCEPLLTAKPDVFITPVKKKNYYAESTNKSTVTDSSCKTKNILEEVEHNRRKSVEENGVRTSEMPKLRGFSTRISITTPLASDRVSFIDSRGKSLTGGKSTGSTLSAAVGGSVPAIAASPDIVMGFINIRETNQVLWTKKFVVLDCGHMNVFQKKLPPPMKPPYGQDLISCVPLDNYTVNLSDGRRIYLQAIAPSGDAHLDSLGLEALGGQQSSFSVAEWVDALNAHILFAQDCAE
jgi:hypothetical protein